MWRRDEEVDTVGVGKPEQRLPHGSETCGLPRVEHLVSAREPEGAGRGRDDQGPLVVGERRCAIEKDALFPGRLRPNDALWPSGRAGCEEEDITVPGPQLP